MSFLLQQNESSGHKNETVPQEKYQDLLIFGYQCKLFQDDAKALEIDNGEHLIPWMGDPSLKIDRYDGRGYLFDLRPYDADNADQRGEPSSDEKRIERLCEEERYLELHTDIAEKALQEEEEIKRLNMELASSSGYQAVGFSYDQPNTDNTEGVNHSPSNGSDGGEAEVQEEDEDSEFIPPPELCLPKSMLYPSGTKLNALVEKTAKFVSSHGGQMEIMIKTKQANNPQFKFLNFEHHLNPYYKHQVYMIKSGRYNPDIHNKPTAAKPAAKAESSGDEDDEGDHSGYLHPSLLAKAPTTTQTTESANTVPHYTQSQLENTAYGKLLKKMSDHMPSITNSPQRTATPTYSDTDGNSQSAFTDRALESAGNGQPAMSDVGGYGMDGYAYDPAYYAQYYQGYSDMSSSTEPRPASPPDDVKPLIERLIGYVRKDGEAFEKQVMAKNDSRFSFMHAGDASHEYYKWRKQCMLAEQYNGDGSRSKGVSFSIKHKEPEVNSIDTSRAALPVDPESDDEQSKSENVNAVTLKESAPRGISPSQYLPNPPASEAVRVEDRPPPSEESLQKKLAEQKLRDKLAAAAREKMTQVTQNTKEKSLQAERKRRAAMFVNMLKNKQKPSSELPPPLIGPELPSGSRSNSPDVSAAQSRLADDADIEYVSSSRGSQSKARSPPSAYSVRINRERGSSRHESREHRHRRDGKASHHRKRRSPSPTLPPKKHKPLSPMRESSLALPPPPRGLLADQETRPSPRRSSSRTTHSTSHSSSHSTTRNTTHGATNSSSLPPPVTANQGSNRDDNEFMLKVRKMLKESRQAVYKEDLFGN